MARPNKVDPAVFASAISEYISDGGGNIVSLIMSDRELAAEISKKLGIKINKEYIRNFRRSQGIASRIGWGGSREGAGRPSCNKPDSDYESLSDIKGVVDLNSRFATERLHEKCVLSLSRMYGGGDRYLYTDFKLNDKGRGTGKVGKSGGIKNVSHSQAFLARSGQ